MSTSEGSSKKSKASGSSRARLHYRFAQEQAQLQLVKAAMEEQEAVQKAAQTRKRTEIETNLKLLEQKQKLLMSEADSDEEGQNSQFQEIADLPPQQKVAEYVRDVSNVPRTAVETAHDQNQNAQLDIAKFMLKKDLVFSRLTNFNDKPEFYTAWKASFKSIMTDLATSANEELDLLIKYLGPESKRHAISLKSVYIANPVMGVTKLWSRLDDQFGTPELIKAAILNKLSALQKIQPKEPKKLYELLDVLLEIQALKEDKKYQAQLSYFDSSEGVLPIVHKLPYNLQEKWVSRAANYKQNHEDQFPPFSVLVSYVSEIAKIKNDPALSCLYFANEKGNRATVPAVSVKKTDVDKKESFQQGFRCPIHKASHSLTDCRIFLAKSVSERKKILKDNRICFKCCSATHKAADCKIEVKCLECGSGRHLTLLHEHKYESSDGMLSYGGERGKTQFVSNVQSKCTKVCGEYSSFGKSCAKVVLVDVYEKRYPCRRLRTYAIIDEQSNRSLASPELFEQLGLHGEQTDYDLNSCSGMSKERGRKVSDCMVEAVDGSCKYSLPPLLECSQIPNARDEIPTSHVAKQFDHLHEIASRIPQLDESAEILILIGRDLISAHHVHEQIIGPKNEPFAQKLGLGWVIVGQVCLGQIHQDDVTCKKTYLLQNGRQSLFPPCPNNIKVKENSSYEEDIFVKSKDDNVVGLSVEDRQFLQFVESKMTKGPNGNWTAPLPFRSGRPKLPNNREYAERRASGLHLSLTKNPTKLEHFLKFMDQIISKGHAEIAPPLKDSLECWYLPLFGVYHPRKPDQIRGVFDASAKFKNISLNDVLLQGPDLINSLIGILLRFRREAVAVSADIERMFYSFLVDEKDRDFLRFFWFEGNDPTKEMIEYRMCVHVFGNRPSPLVANFGLQKTAALSESEFGSDVKEYVSRNFYVDDGLTSKASVEEAVDLMKRTQVALQKNGNLRLHKVASNEERVLESFSPDDLAKELALLDLTKDCMPVQRSLGLLWDLKSDSFTFSAPVLEKPFTRRGVLSVVNSLYDPLGFVAPVSVVGKILLKTMTSDGCGWDEPLPERFLSQWLEWSSSLKSLKEIDIPRMYFRNSVSQFSHHRLLLFSDASEKAIASVAYLVSHGISSAVQASFVMGKAKVAPSKGHTIPRLELCAAVMSVEIADFILSQIDVEIQEVSYFTDSKVVLGYVSNKRRRFYTYVANRVERILSSSLSDQWFYIDTEHNPADVGTRGVLAKEMSNSSWLKGPPEKVLVSMSREEECHTLQDPDLDKEIRPQVTCMATKSVQETSSLNIAHFQNCSSFEKLKRAISVLQHICRSFKGSCQCVGWHRCVEASSRENLDSAQTLILKASQVESFSDEILCLKQGKPVSKSSSLIALNPVLDDNGLLRVGGRLKHSNLPSAQKNPVLVSGKCHIGLLLIRQFHEQVAHQGRHFTEGAIRAGGFWITGGRKRISSYISDCCQCRKLRGQRLTQIMADLPADRLVPAPPFTYVGVDVFGPWSIVSRRSRGCRANKKRWAVLFTCLTIRAVHIELVEEMSSSAFINALRRFMSVRGEVLEFRSDRGTNFVGSTADLGVNVVNVEDRPVQKLLQDKGVTWIFNPPHASHMGAVWERMIGVVRKVLDSLLTGPKLQNLTHEVLATFMAEVCAIVNARPIVPVSSDSEAPEILCPSMLLNHKSTPLSSFSQNLTLKDAYRSEWKRVQVLADQFWARWRSEFLTNLQKRQKWTTPQPNLKVADIVLLRDESLSRNQWPMAVVAEIFPSSDSKVRSARVKYMRDKKINFLIRPITELVLLISE